MNELIYTTIPLNLLIHAYEPIQFECGGFKYSDRYTPPIEGQSHGSYVICIATDEITEHKLLNHNALKLSEHAELVTMLLKYATGTSLFHECDGIDLRRKRMIFAGDCPQGWSSNYKELDELLDTNPIRLIFSHEPPRPYAQVPKSPLVELHVMLQKYNSLDATTKYLMRLNYEADIAADLPRNLVYGKVIEIIDAIHPIKPGKDDKRIEEFYPGMQDAFHGMTIKDLMGLANSRADTRHYAKQKGDVQAHPFLTYDELGMYGPLIDNLAINEVRARFGLPFVTMVYGG